MVYQLGFFKGILNKISATENIGRFKKKQNCAWILAEVAAPLVYTQVVLLASPDDQ